MLTRRAATAASPLSRIRSAPARERIHAEPTRSLARDVEEEEAVDHRELPMVDDRPETVRRVRHEVGHRHQAAREERDIAGEQPQGHQGATEELDDARGGHERNAQLALASKRPEELLRPVACEE